MSSIGGANETRAETLTRHASYYADAHHGKKMASSPHSGEPHWFNMYSLTVAHKHYPFGTRLHLLNLANNRTAEVTVCDRGPFVAGRDLDVSYQVALNLDFVARGHTDLRVTITYQPNKEEQMEARALCASPKPPALTQKTKRVTS